MLFIKIHRYFVVIQFWSDVPEQFIIPETKTSAPISQGLGGHVHPWLFCHCSGSVHFGVSCIWDMFSYDSMRSTVVAVQVCKVMSSEVDV